MKTKIITDKAPKAVGPYSQAIIDGNLIFTSGQIHLTSDGKLVQGSIEGQVHQIMNNLKAVFGTGRRLLLRPVPGAGNGLRQRTTARGQNRNQHGRRQKIDIVWQRR